MSTRLEDDFKKIDEFLNLAKMIDIFADCNDIYELFGITNRDTSYPEIEVKINEFVKRYSATTGAKFKNLQRTVSGAGALVKRVLKENKDEFDNYLKDKLKEQLKKLFVFAVGKDKELQPDEEESIIEEGDKLGLDQSEVSNFINELLRSHGARRGTLDALVRNYYELLNVPEDADYKKIKAAYDREHQKYIKSRDKVKASARFTVVSEAWGCLKDPAKKRKYDEEQRRKREKGLTREGAPKLEIVDESGKEKRRFEFKDMKLGDTSSVTVIAKNGGGGTLDAKIVMSCPWLIVDTDRIHQSKLPQHITITVDPKKHQRENCLGGHDKGVIEITYPEASKPEKIYVDFSIEIEKEALIRFSKFLTVGGLILGGLFGYFIYNLSLIHGMNVNVAGIAGIVALVGAVIAAGKLGYQDEGFGAAFGFGCMTLVALFIIIAILDSYFPHALSVFSWTVVYGSFANLLSTPIRRAFWRGNLAVPIMAGTMILALTVGIICGGFFSAKQERETEIVRAKAELIRSKAIQKIIQTTASKLPGEWHGNMGKTKIKLFITRESNQLSGKMLNYKHGVEQKLSVNFKNKAGQIVIILKGTSYKQSKGRRIYSLDTFYGTLSRDGGTIKGTYEDTRRNRGKWSVSKHSIISCPGRLFVKTEPADTTIRILNIRPIFYQGMKLASGRYHVEISAKGYKAMETWVELRAGHDKTINICLTRKPGTITDSSAINSTKKLKRQNRYDLINLTDKAVDEARRAWGRAVRDARLGHDTKATLEGAAIGSAIGGLAGAGAGHYMDKQEQALRQAVAASEAAAVERQGDILSVTLKSDFLFDVDSSVVQPGAYSEIDRLAMVFTQYPDTRIRIEGHTDSTGPEEYNLHRSQRRAEAVKQLLASKVVYLDRMTAIGYGESRPKAGNDTPYGRQLNRRVEIYIQPR